MVLLSSLSRLPSSTSLETKEKPRNNWRELKRSCSCRHLVPLILKKIVPYTLGADGNKLLFYWTWKQCNKNTKTSLCFWILFVLQKTTSESQVPPLTNQEYLGLSSHAVDTLGQVHKFKAIYLGVCSTLHIQNINSTIHSIMRGLNETASNYCFCKSPNNLPTCVALILRLTSFSLYVNATRAPKLLEESNNQKRVIFQPATERISNRETKH